MAGYYACCAFIHIILFSRRCTKSNTTAMATILWTLRAAVLAVLTASIYTMILCVGSVLLRLLNNLPRIFLPEKLQRYLDKRNSLNMSYKAFLTLLRLQYLRFICPLKVGLEARNIDILTLDKVKKKLLDFQKEGRPLVVNFGSMS